MFASKLKKLLICCTFAVIIILAGSAASAQVVVTPEPGVDAASLAQVQRTIQQFDKTLFAYTGRRLTRDVTLIVCPTRESYSLVLQREIGYTPEKADKDAANTNGQSWGRKQLVIVCASANPLKLSDTVAHELYHQYQDETSAGRYIASPAFVVEGTAGLVAGEVVHALGGKDASQWFNDQVERLKKAPRKVNPELLFTTDYGNFEAMCEKYGDSVYPTSFLMAAILCDLQKGRGFANFARYFELQKAGHTPLSAFVNAFGIDPLSFLNTFINNWYTVHIGPVPEFDEEFSN
jgi:hypothetical protein